MGILDFLKKIIKAEDFEEIISKKLKLSEVNDWTETEIMSNEIKEAEVLLEIRKDIEIFIKELKEKIIILENFDVDSIKESERMKKVVKDSRKLYITSAEDLIERLNDLNEPKLEKFIEKINKIFVNFNKSSFKNYERTTILIGKEMVNIKEIFSAFSKNLLEIFKKNKDILDFFKEIQTIKEKLSAISSVDRILENIIQKKSDLNEKLSEKEKENATLEEKLEEIKKSSAYLENISKQKEFSHKKDTLEETILELKHLIDFKSLANFFHANPKQMKTVQNYRDDFEMNFKKDKGAIILKLIDETEINKDKILEKLQEIEKQTQEIENYKKNLGKDETQSLFSKIKENNSKIEDIVIEKVKDERHEVRLKDEKKELIDNLRQELVKVNVELI